jgi:GTPase SAR1 family protein
MTPLLLILVSVLALSSASGPFSSKSGNPFARPGNFGGDRTVNNVASPVAEDMGTEEAMPIPTSRPKQTKEREQLYEAYNLLHTLAQDFHKPFDAPAVVVVGHQTSGKSALIEALMGFQFNQVGGGTKTRRPIALRMQYNPACTSPMCFLTLENGKEEQRSLTDIQTYIEAENRRLERDPTRSFDTREINIRMEYRFCPNMIVIDTPGMLHSPKGRNLNPQQRALAQAAREAEGLVLSKMRCKDYIILCVEDTTDWKHATTRNVVMQADPELSRSVLVTTKLDTKLPQFSEGEDLQDFLEAPLVNRLYPHMLGGPFFTSVPCGRVGHSKEYGTNEGFVRALQGAEIDDSRSILSKVGAHVSRPGLQRVGVSRLRSFLEARVEDCYRRNVAKIVPLLQSELRHAEDKLHNTELELEALSLDRLRQSANVYREAFSKQLAEAVHGTVKASPDEWGETLDAEQLRGGSFLEQDQVNSESWKRLLEIEVGNGQHKLFGGAQYHRSIREFTVAVRHMRSPVVTEDEIANAAGMGDMHDGVNFMRAACIIAVEKAEASFDPMLEALRHRSTHIMRRMLPIVEDMLRKGSSRLPPETHSAPLKDSIRRIYEKFIDEHLDDCLRKCRDDLLGMTRFVSWDVEGKSSSSALYRSLPTPKRMVEIYSIAVESRTQKSMDKGTGSKKAGKRDRIMEEWEAAGGASAEDGSENVSLDARDRALAKSWSSEDARVDDYHDLLQLTEEMLGQRNAGRTNTVVTALVQYIIRSWRDHFARTVAMKFNCFFLMPFLDDFPAYLRQELDDLYDGDVGDLFDIQEARSVLSQRRNDLIAECEANSKLQRRFDKINAQLTNDKGGAGEEAEAPRGVNYYNNDNDYDESAAL